MKQQFANLLTVIANLLIVAGLFLLVVFSCDDPPHTSDALLEENFYKHEAELDLLAKMAAEDADMIRIAPNFSWHKQNVDAYASKAAYGFSDDRWAEYKKLFQKIGKNKGILNYQPDQMFVSVSSRGMVTGGSSKGYAYLPKEPSPILESLDNVDFKNSNKSTNLVYKRLKGNWYLYYEVND